jgi:hypothetical protein
MVHQRLYFWLKCIRPLKRLLTPVWTPLFQNQILEWILQNLVSRLNPVTIPFLRLRLLHHRIAVVKADLGKVDLGKAQEVQVDQVGTVPVVPQWNVVWLR